MVTIRIVSLSKYLVKLTTCPHPHPLHTHIIVIVLALFLLVFQGVLHESGNPCRIYLQGVHQLYDFKSGAPWNTCTTSDDCLKTQDNSTPPLNRLVFIGEQYSASLLIERTSMYINKAWKQFIFLGYSTALRRSLLLHHYSF